jgi:hypothetical protein
VDVVEVEVEVGAAGTTVLELVSRLQILSHGKTYRQWEMLGKRS